MRSILVTLKQELLPAHSLDQGRLDGIIVSNKVVGGPVSDISGSRQVCKIRRDAQKRRMVADDDVDLDGRVGPAS
jgi:hypothetical protein